MKTLILYTLLFGVCFSVNAQIQTGVFKSTSTNTDYHHFTRNGSGAAVYINQIDAIQPILRLGSGDFNANVGVKFTFENNGNFGIGTLTPNEHISIYSDFARLSVTGQSGNSAILLGNQDSGGVNNPAVVWAANGNLFLGGGSSWNKGGTLTSALTVGDNGNVSIGTGTTPSSSHRLNVNGSTKINGSLTTGDDNWGALFIDGKDKNDWLFNAHNDGKSFHIRTQSDTGTTSSRHIMSMNRLNSRVGIGVSSPAQKLDVAGNVLSNSFKTKANNTEYNHFIRNGTGAVVYVNQLLNTQPILRLSSGTAAANQGVKFTVEYDGSVGIGTTELEGYQLAVAGKAVAEEIVVKLQSNWPDYVFAKDYELPTLKQVEQQIKIKGHLANIPSAKDVAENGIALGDMNKKLLEKIEELTLYTIQQDREIKDLQDVKNDVEAIKQENKTLKERLVKIEQLLNAK